MMRPGPTVSYDGDHSAADRKVGPLPRADQARTVDRACFTRKHMDSPYVIHPDRIAVRSCWRRKRRSRGEHPFYSDLTRARGEGPTLVRFPNHWSLIWDNEGPLSSPRERALPTWWATAGMISLRVVSFLFGPTLTLIGIRSGIDEQAVAEVKATGSCKAYEKEYFVRMASGACYVGGAKPGGRREQGVAFFVID